MKDISLRHWRSFEAAASLGSFSRAAESLDVTQPAISMQIRQLEDRIGENLFSREGRRLVLTDTGQLVLSYADNIFGLGQEMLGRLQGQSQGIMRLRVGSVATLSRNYQENWIRPLLTESSLVFTLESGMLDDLLARLVQHQLDVVLANETVPTNPERLLHSHFLGSQPVSLVGPSNVWKANSLRLPEDLQGVDVAVPGPRHAVRGQFDALCAAAGITPRLRAEVDDMAMLRLIARDSGWLTVLPDVVVQDELRVGSLVSVGQSAQLQERFYAITTPHRHRTDIVERLLSHSPQNRHSIPSFK